MTEFVIVVDMDETLGYFEKDTFHVRPDVDYFVKVLKLAQFDFILWSHGMDDYVSMMVSNFLPVVALNATWIFGRSECERSDSRYGYRKCSHHIRQLYDHPIVLIALDDNVKEEMDNGYDLRLHIEPYNKRDEADRALIEATKKIVNFCHKDSIDPNDCIRINVDEDSLDPDKNYLSCSEEL